MFEKLLKSTLLILAIILVITVIYDLLSVGEALTTGAAVRIVLFGIRKLLYILFFAILILLVLKFAGNVDWMHTAFNHITQLIRESNLTNIISTIK